MYPHKWNNHLRWNKKSELTMHQMTKEISNLWGKLKMERPRKANTHVSGIGAEEDFVENWKERER